MPDPCDVCRAPDTFEPWLEVSVSGVFERWVQRCRACGFRQIRPRVTRGEIDRLYPPAYFDATQPIGYSDYAREAQRRRREAYFLTRRRRGVRPPERVLEVGCALGFLLHALRDRGCDVTGVDAAPFAAYYARTRFGVPVTCGTLGEAAFPDAAFDLVIQKDVLEHVDDPRGHLMETARVMAPGGALWLVTPNGEANLRPLGRSSAAAAEGLPLMDQGHLSFFSERHLQVLFADCGLEVLQARVLGVRRGLRALGRLPGQRRFVRRAARAERSPPAEPVPHEDLARRIDAAVAAQHRRVRGWRPYYWLHRASKRLDTLPAWTAVGYDFEFWLRRH